MELKYPAFSFFFFFSNLARTHSIKPIVLKGIEKKLGMSFKTCLADKALSIKKRDNTNQQIISFWLLPSFSWLLTRPVKQAVRIIFLWALGSRFQISLLHNACRYLVETADFILPGDYSLLPEKMVLTVCSLLKMQ